jgi:hypothetical protein
VRSPAFKRSLTDLVTRELQSLGAEQVKDVVDPRRVRALIHEWDVQLTDVRAVADLVIQVNRRLERRLKRRRESLVDLLDQQMGAHLDAVIDAAVESTAQAEELVTRMMRQEFVRRLFTDIIFTSIVSFYQKVNPLFGALTTRVLEEQIKGFIQLVLPVIQRQAIAFALSTANQRVVAEFTRSIVRQLLNEPLGNYALNISPAQRKKAEALVRHAIGNTTLETLMRRAALAVWDDLYATMRNRRVGDIVRLDTRAPWLAERIIEAVLPALSRPRVLAFLAAETAIAGRPSPPRPSPSGLRS